MRALPFAIQRYERRRIPALFFASIAAFALAMDVTHNDISAARTVLYAILTIPLALPRNLTYVTIGSLLLSCCGLALTWCLLLLFSWGSGQKYLTNPGSFFFAAFSITCSSLSAAAVMVYYGLNDSIPSKKAPTHA